MTHPAKLANLSDYSPLTPKSRSTFAELERVVRETSRVFGGSFTTEQAKKSAIASLVRAEKLCVAARIALRSTT